MLLWRLSEPEAFRIGTVGLEERSGSLSDFQVPDEFS